MDLGDGPTLEALVYSYLAAMSGGRLDLIPRERHPDVSDAGEEALSRDLRTRLLDPLADALAGCRTIFVAPDGVICRVPFAALLDDAPSTTRLIDRLAVGYVANGRGVLEFGADPPEAGEPPVVVGDPDYDFDRPGTLREPPPLVDGFVDFYFEGLPGTADEAWRVSQLLGGRRLTRKSATEAALQACRSPAILHVATHGYYVRPFAQGMMVIGDWRRAFGTTFRGEVLGFAGQPFLRSGLALAGVNAWSEDRPLPRDVGDGLLSSADIARMDLAGTELVVLSACSGALGDVAPGDGVAGLLHGCQLAGARATVASLWPIPDEEATGALMAAFYRELLRGRSRLEALRAAQAGVRATQPPWQWASYVSYGDPGPIRYRRPTDTSRSD